MFPAAAPLKWSDNLELAAQRHSDYMAETRRMSHEGRGGSNVAQRALAAGYAWSWIGENVAVGYRDAAAVLNGWASSPGHCRNLMSQNAVHMGVAVSYSAEGRPYWTQVLARPGR